MRGPKFGGGPRLSVLEKRTLTHPTWYDKVRFLPTSTYLDAGLMPGREAQKMGWGFLDLED